VTVEASMRVPRACLSVLAVTVGCGSSFSAADDAGTGDASSSNEAGDATEAGDAASDGGACPDEIGKYAVIAVGAGCGDLPPTASECIAQAACGITLAPAGPAGTKGVLGTAALAGDGSFTDATLMEGSTSRNGCAGSWDPTTSKLTIDCGGVGTTQSCHATLTRTSSTCD
jgi:hypothetical protein